MRIVVALTLLVLATGCGEDARLEATSEAIKADGVSSVTLTFHADQPDGTSVTFETDRGHFGDDYQYVDRALGGGSTTVELYSGLEPGRATVVAESERGDTASISIEFSALRPSGRNLSFQCDVVNIAAYAEPVPDLAVPCRLTMQDRDGTTINPIGLSSDEIGFLAEAGQIERTEDWYGNLQFLYTARGGPTAPIDVDPIDREPSRSGDTGGTRNPRDGLVTLVAWVLGEEGFNDINSNGVYEPEAGETFIDSGEPFVDVDDDGVFNPMAGDTYRDINGDGRYTEPNGRWDEAAILWTTFKILWSGPVHESAETSRIELQGGREIPTGATREISAYLLDRNINPLAATSTDQASLYPTCSACSYPSTYNFSLSNTRGFEVDSHGSILGNLFETPRFSITVTNTNTYATPETFSISATADVTPAPQDAGGNAPYPTHVELSAFEATLAGDPSAGG